VGKALKLRIGYFFSNLPTIMVHGIAQMEDKTTTFVNDIPVPILTLILSGS
jgi:hypothetical protein